jgi:thiosulfate sulfurtransferase
MTHISVENLALNCKAPAPWCCWTCGANRPAPVLGLKYPGTTWRNPAHWLDWKDEFLQTPRVVVYCAHGHEISQGLTLHCGPWG